MLGPHLTIDLYGCNKAKLADGKLILSILNNLPKEIGMNKFSEPQITNIPEQGEHSFDRGGVTGFVILVESHMSIHTFPEDGYASFDIFSCKDFNTKQVTSLIKKSLGAKKAELNLINRGVNFVKHYPRSPEKATEINLKERVERATLK